MVTTNNGRLKAFKNNGVADKLPLKIELRSKIGNENAFGSMVTLIRQDGTQQAFDCAAGSGYLSQSAAGIFVGRGSNPVSKAKVVWPNGDSSAHEIKPNSPIIQLNQPVSE